MQSREEIRNQKFLMIEAWQQSGLSQKVWCSQESIAYHSFHYWYKRYRVAHPIGSSSGLPDKSHGFSVLKVQSSFYGEAAVNMELLLTDGRRLLFHSPVSSDYIKAIIS